MRLWERAIPRRVVGVLTSGLLVALLMTPSISDANSHWILLDPPAAPVGGEVKVSGNGFLASSTVRVYFGSVSGPVLATTNTRNSQGRINTRFVVPDRPLGFYTIVACSIDPGTGTCIQEPVTDQLQIIEAPVVTTTTTPPEPTTTLPSDTTTTTASPEPTTTLPPDTTTTTLGTATTTLPGDTTTTVVHSPTTTDPGTTTTSTPEPSPTTTLPPSVTVPSTGAEPEPAPGEESLVEAADDIEDDNEDEVLSISPTPELEAPLPRDDNSISITRRPPSRVTEASPEAIFPPDTSRPEPSGSITSFLIVSGLSAAVALLVVRGRGSEDR